MAADYFRRFRGSPSLTPKRKAELLKALSVGAPLEMPCEAVGIIKDTFCRWMRSSSALHVGEDSIDMRHFAPGQPDENDEAWRERKHRYDLSDNNEPFVDGKSRGI